MTKLSKIAMLVLSVTFVLAFASCEKEVDEVPTYTVTFDSDGGSVVEQQTVKEGKKAIKPAADPEKEGYKFAGWYNGDEVFDFETAIKTELTLKAHWTIKSYTVTFDTDGGSEVAAKTVDYNGKATKPADPKKEGYIFSGWYNGDTQFNFNTAITTNVTIKAHWGVLLDDLYSKIAAGETDITVTLTCDGYLRPEDDYSNNGKFNPGKDYALIIPAGVTVKIQTDGVPRDLKMSARCGNMISVYGTLIIEENVNMSGSVHWDAIHIYSGGSVTMNGGSISGFSPGGSAFASVYIEKGGLFYMNGGLITNNKLNGAVGVYGSFEMTDGSISGNATNKTVFAGGVTVFKDGVFNMTGGSITENTNTNTSVPDNTLTNLYIREGGTYNNTKYAENTEITF